MPIGRRSTGGLVGIQMITTGDGYGSAPSISFSGGGGTGAEAIAFMNGTRVESIIITNPGSGYTQSPVIHVSGNCEARAYAYTGPRRPASFFRGRHGDVYAVDGMGRGLRWTGDDAQMEKIGIVRPGAAPTCAATSVAGEGQRVVAVEIVDRGAGYFEEPDITFSGGGGSTQAKGQAVIRNGLLNEVRVLDSGAGYSSPPEITISGGNGSGAALSVGLTGTVDAFELLSGGTGFTEAPTITFNNVWQEIPAGSGVTYPAAATCSIDGGVINEVRFSDYGRGATTDVQATFTGGGGTGLSFDLDTKFGVQTVTASNTGQGYFANPVVIFKPDANDDRAQAAEATAVATSLGNLQAITVTKAGVYYKEPTAEIAMPSAVAVARLSKNLKGEYHCYTRYLDDTPLDKKGPIPSSISAHAKVTIENGARAIQWDFTHPYVDDRVARMELWRSSPDQNVLLFRIATLDFGGNLYTQGNVQIVTETGDNIITEHSEPTTYTDTVNDEDIESQERGEFGMMMTTVVVPSSR